MAAGSLLVGFGMCRGSPSVGSGGSGDEWNFCGVDPVFVATGTVLMSAGIAMVVSGGILIHRGKRERHEAGASTSPTAALPRVDLAFALTPGASYARLELRF